MTSPIKKTPHPNSQSGFSLIEVLVTVVVMAIGSLGIAALQIAGLNYSSGAYARTQAVLLSDDIINRMKINRAEALNEAADGSLGTAGDSNYYFPTLSSTFTPSKNCVTTTTPCTPAELAEYDRSAWLADVERALPSGRGSINITDSTNGEGIVERLFTITLEWRQVANSTNENTTDLGELKNFSFKVTL
ncbi:MAG: type IV pilus modification protein PilV [Acidiferrobacterales bacterium]|nr:type IV pilus modification protein PilV [Acidiferrobacterales bacterium]